jgi:hypothetical protein
MNCEIPVRPAPGFRFLGGLARDRGWGRVSTLAQTESKRTVLWTLLPGWESKRPLIRLENRWPVTLEVAGSSPVAPAIDQSFSRISVAEA